jgi:hypothetical protein
MSEPRAVVEAFIAAYHAWTDEGDEAIETSYRALVDRFCPPDTPCEPVSYGEPGLHDPARERVDAVAEQGATAVVTTVAATAAGGTSRFEYQLVHDHGRWWVLGIDVLADGTRFPSL